MTDGVSASATPGCVVCDTPLVAHLAIWLKRCPRCGLRVSSLGAEVVSVHTPGAWDQHNAAALAALREDTAMRLLDEIAQLVALNEVHLLDVGCGPAWFLNAARGRCAGVKGLEPDEASAAQARARGLDVTHGRFPEHAPKGPFEVVSFNDVFEHLPAPEMAVASLLRLLRDQGLVVITAPSRQGFFYRVAELLARCGIKAPLERMWQRGFVSPHHYYYEPATLDALFAHHGLRCVRGFELPSVSRTGLWARIGAGRRMPIVFAALIYVGCLLLLPVLHWLPADIQVRIYARSEFK